MMVPASLSYACGASLNRSSMMPNLAGQTWAALGESPRIQMLSFESAHVQVVSCVPTDTCIQFF